MTLHFTLELDGLPAIIFSDLRLPHQDCAAVQRPFNAHLITQERRKRQGRSNEGMKNFLVRQNSSGKSHFQALLATVLITHVIVSGIGMIFQIAVCINQSPFPNGCPVFAGSFRRHLPLSARWTCLRSSTVSDKNQPSHDETDPSRSPHEKLPSPHAAERITEIINQVQKGSVNFLWK